MEDMRYKTGQLFVQLGNAVTWYRNGRMKALGLTSSQSGVMRYIQKNRDKNVTAGELMTKLYLSKPTISKIIKQLEKKGLLERHVDESDFRKRIITLTEKGLSLESELLYIGVETESILLRGMQNEEKAEFQRLLWIALNNINKSRIPSGTKKISSTSI